VFGNEDEADIFAQVNNFGTKDRKEIAKKISEMPLEGHKSRIVVITQGADNVILVDESGEVSEIPITKVENDQVNFVTIGDPCFQYSVSFIAMVSFINEA